MIENTLPPTSPEISQWLMREKVKMLYSNFRKSWLLSVLVSGLMAFVAISAGNYSLGIGWWALFLLILYYRYHLVTEFFQTDISLEFSEKWLDRFTLRTFLSGLAWGLGGIFLGSQLEPVDQVFILLILIGVSGGAIPLVGINQKTMLAFQIPTVFPYMLWVAWLLQDKGVLLVMIAILYLASTVLAMRRLEKSVTENLVMKYLLEQKTEELQDENSKLEHMTMIDSLTQIYNRRYFETQFDREWKKAQRESQCLSLLVIDIDYFKLYNDTYGHAEGDECLKRVTRQLSSAIQRPADFIARLGGEEFVVLLPGIDVDGAQTVAQSMQKNLSQAKCVHATSPIDDCVTVSMGLAMAFPEPGVSSLMLFQAADKALYQAKNRGRNQIVIGEVEIMDSEIA